MANQLTSEIVKELGINAGATIVGIAASKDFGLAPEGFRPSDNLEGCLSVIVLGLPSPQEALNDTVEYTASRNVMLTQISNIAKEVAKRIKAAGFKSKAISATGGKWVEGDGRKEQFGYISLKHAAEIAGLGIIGKNYLLTNPQYGNLLWLSAVLTDADLVPDQRAQYSICENCNRCVEMCPSGALNDLTAFGKKGCSKFFTMANGKLEIQCYLCRKVCPYRFGKPV